jgi:muconolactone D-isomerase
VKQIYLVSLPARIPPDMPAEVFEPLAEREKARVQELYDAGVIERIWRVPGRRESVGIWRAESADELHRVLESLPLYPWQEIEVRALAAHWLEDDRQT